jgi:carboxymethylenebutenolidase
MSEVVSKVSIPQMMGDIDAAVAWVEKSGKGAVSKLAVTGFCWGGWANWHFAAHKATLKAAVPWYGHIIRQGVAKNPIDVVKDLKCPVMGLYGGKDQGIPLDTVEMIQSEAKKAGKNVQIHVYPDAGHGFHADYRPSYRETDAKDGWRRMHDFFKANGVA